MRFGDFYMNGYGIHHDQLFKVNTAAPAVLFYGHNEAGKSTIMGFMRAMLFGFPTRAHMPERYEPVRGGSYGGWLTIIDERGEQIKLERYDKKGYPKLTYADGSITGDAVLQAMLGGMRAEQFRNLFAFSLSELQTLDTLQADEVGGFLLSSGMGLNGNTILQAERKIAAQMDQLYKRGGTKLPMNVMLKEIEAGEAELRRSKDNSTHYNRLQVELEELDQSIANQLHELDQLRQEADWMNKCIQTRQAWFRVQAISRELDSEELRLQVSSAEAAELQGAGELDHLLAAVQAYEDNGRKLIELRSELESEQGAMQRGLRQISPDWTVDDAKRFPITVADQETLSAYTEAFTSLAARKGASKQERDRTVRELEDTTQQVEECEASLTETERLKTERMPEAAATDLSSYEAQLRKDWARLRDDAAELAHTAVRLEDALVSEQTITAKRGQRSARSAGRSSAWLWFAALSGIGGSSAVWWLTDNATLGALLIAAVVLLTGFTIIGLSRTTGAGRELEGMQHELKTRIVSIRHELESGRQRLTASMARLAQQLHGAASLAEAAAGAAAAYGGKDQPVKDMLHHMSLLEEAMEREFVVWRKLTQESERWKDRAAAAELALAQLRKQLQDNEREAAQLEEEEASLRDEWAVYVNRFRLSSELRPESVKLLRQYAEQAIAASERLAKLEERRTILTASIAEYEERVTDWLNRMSLPVPSAPSELVYTLRQAKAHFGKLMDIATRRNELQQERSHLEASIAMWIKPEQLELLREHLQTYDADQLERSLTTLQQAARTAEQLLHEKKEKRGELRGELERLQVDEGHSQLLQLQQERLAAFEQAAAEYARYALTAQLIKKSREVYEKERQPDVLRLASSYFAQMTDGRYTRITSRLGEKTIFAETASGDWISSAYLSRGTAEQLYLAMRFALADEYAKTVSLPIIMDDIFVNFDQHRLARSLSLLHDVAKRHQLLLFTCHEHVKDAIAAALPETQLIAL